MSEKTSQEVKKSFSHRKHMGGKKKTYFNGRLAWKKVMHRHELATEE